MKAKLRAWVVLAALIALLCPRASAAFGARGGVTMSWTSENGPIHEMASSLWAFQAGFSYRLPLTGLLSLQGEANLAMKGASYYSIDHRNEQAVHFDYLEFPVLLNASYGRFDVFGGPFVAILVHSTPLGWGNDWSYFNAKLRDVDLGVMVGLRYFVRSFWFVEARCGWGFVPTVSLPDAPWVSPYRNQTVYLSVGFELGR
jgi:hypothetical protein